MIKIFIYFANLSHVLFLFYIHIFVWFDFQQTNNKIFPSQINFYIFFDYEKFINFKDMLQKVYFYASFSYIFFSVLWKNLLFCTPLKSFVIFVILFVTVYCKCFWEIYTVFIVYLASNLVIVLFDLVWPMGYIYFCMFVFI